MRNSKTALRGNDIRKVNEKLVLRLIQQEKVFSQSEAVEITGLKPPTILRIFTNLEEDGLIEVSDARKVSSDRKGRKPVYYRLNPEALYVVGVEFWSRSASVVISNFVREPVYSDSLNVDPDKGSQAVVRKVSSLIERSLKAAGIVPGQLAGIGIGAPGRVDIETGKVLFYSRIDGLNDFNITEFFEDKFNVPVIVHNNCSVIALNEYHSKKMENDGNIMAVLIRGGVGGSYINQGRVLTSSNITTMEIGHMSIDPDGDICSCGSKGCLETLLSEEAILTATRKAAGIDNITDLESALYASGEPADKLAPVLDEKAEVLAYAIRNLNQLLSPGKFLIISRSLELSRRLADGASDILNCNGIAGEYRLEAVLYDPMQAGMGACDIVFQEYFTGGL
ncbi:MAG: ROK family transcriptional regulator [Spirochaetales bacterium]|uniref:ROK family transcriptional regulator n=1 Tax=Candidatus Thalassospirochaeta sargassi TaxID=3119039 RepID=A0AAJ1IGH4_9SPIO|nr:ROK family transcriptional regulator [Spirochaetales bacterium]